MAQLTLHVIPAPTLEYIINQDGALVVVIRNWLPTARDLHDRLLAQIPWINANQNMYGKIIPIPRAMFFLGDPHVKTYTYSRLTFPVRSWQSDNPLYQEIESIRTNIQTDPTLRQLLGLELHYNTCLLNLYLTGANKISAHPDKEALGPANAVVTVSLGGTRTCIFKSQIKGPNGRYPKIEVPLNNGDLLLMAGRCQELWTHAIEREDTNESRISLTYRLIRA